MSAKTLADRLHLAKRQLSNAYNRLNSQLAEAEDAIASSGISSPVWATIESTSDDNGWDFESCLVCQKIGGEWRLCFSRGVAGDPDTWSAPKPVLECSLEIRKLAVVGLPIFFERIITNIVNEADQIFDAIAKASSAIDSFRTSSIEKESHSQETLMKVRDVLKLLQEDGWMQVATRGSHRQFKHQTKLGRVTVAGKPSDDLPPGTLNSILKQAGLR